ncbi:hypothetical protein [Pseudomonas nitroreducens]|uniref:hypothetical protein n=1 Tax=Pseudomonas nitroreducens TaxID=46680 RepID=UPI0006865710
MFGGLQRLPVPQRTPQRLAQQRQVEQALHLLAAAQQADPRQLQVVDGEQPGQPAVPLAEIAQGLQDVLPGTGATAQLSRQGQPQQAGLAQGASPGSGRAGNRRCDRPGRSQPEWNNAHGHL